MTLSGGFLYSTVLRDCNSPDLGVSEHVQSSAALLAVWRGALVETCPWTGYETHCLPPHLPSTPLLRGCLPSFFRHQQSSPFLPV